MTRINILPPLVADMIAAGEVVERPASVIKELMENSFDAGASKVTVEFKSGGATYIKITDDGCGMSPEDAGIAFTRHATSKLHDEKGLEAIGTMGFRGEALAAIAAVSRIELITREKGAAEGVRVVVQAGDIIDMSPIGCPEGTSITVRDIFHNTPARLKFLKSDRSEASACISAALHCALGRPEVSVRLKRDGEEVFFTPGDGREESAVYALLGRETARGMLPVSGKGESMAVTGFTSSPAFGRGNRANQHFYCNGRYIKSVLLQSAVEQAYRNTLLTGKFPSCVLYLELSRGAVDVNVHPAKTEVKFSDEKKVFDLVYQTVRACLEAEEKPIEITLSEGTRRAVSAPKPEFFRSMSAEEYPEIPVISEERSFRLPAETLRSMILKTADQVQKTTAALTAKLEEEYVASSDFGSYVAKLSAQLEAAPEAVTQYYSFFSDLQANVEKVDAVFAHYKLDTEGYIRTGIVYYDGAAPVYGVAVGQDLTCREVDGEKVVEQNNFRAVFTATRLSFWQDATEVAYVSNNRLYITNITVLGGIDVGQWSMEAAEGGLAFRWIGG